VWLSSFLSYWAFLVFADAQVRQEEGGAALKKRVGGCVLAGLWGRLGLDRVPQRLLAESRGLRAPHRGLIF